eukprot:2564194-Pyramimonas_sp.AAC.1
MIGDRGRGGRARPSCRRGGGQAEAICIRPHLAVANRWIRRAQAGARLGRRRRQRRYRQRR